MALGTWACTARPALGHTSDHNHNSIHSYSQGGGVCARAALHVVASSLFYSLYAAPPSDPSNIAYLTEMMYAQGIGSHLVGPIGEGWSGMSRKQAQEIEQLKMALDAERAQRQTWQDSAVRARNDLESTSTSLSRMQRELAERTAERDAANAKVAELEKMLAVEQNRRRTKREDADLKLQLLGWSGCDTDRARKAYHWLRGSENENVNTTIEASGPSIRLKDLEAILKRIQDEQPQARLSVAAALGSAFRAADRQSRRTAC